MNAKGDANRSVRQTKQRLYEALIHLLQQKSLREITVRELTELAGISRGTFYFHYADIYALMEQMESVQLARLESLMDNLIPNISREDVPPALTALFSYMNDNPEVCHAFYGKNWESDFTRNARPPLLRAAAGQRRRHPAPAISAGLCGKRLLWQHRSLAGCWLPAPAGGNGRHHLAGHPRGEGVVVTRQIQKGSP